MTFAGLSARVTQKVKSSKHYEHFNSPLGQKRQIYNRKDSNEKRRRKISDYRVNKISIAVYGNSGILR